MELKHVAMRDGRLSSFLKDEMKMSTGLVNRLKWQQKIFVNGAPQHNDFAVKAGDVITALLDEEEPNYPPQDGDLFSESGCTGCSPPGTEDAPPDGRSPARRR